VSRCGRARTAHRRRGAVVAVPDADRLQLL